MNIFKEFDFRTLGGGAVLGRCSGIDLAGTHLLRYRDSSTVFKLFKSIDARYFQMLSTQIGYNLP